MSYSRYDYLLDRQVELFRELRNLKAFPELDGTGKLLVSYSKEIDAVEAELDKLNTNDLIAACSEMSENHHMVM